MKRVKKHGSYFTLESRKLAESTERLCDQCGNAECSVRAILRRIAVNRYNAKIQVLRCDSFIPQLEFRDPSGCAGEFNTFRLGGAWASRVVPGQLVSLACNARDWQLPAEVTYVDVGPFEEMRAKYGVDNHLAIDAEISGKPFDLAKVMRECYGGHRFNESSVVSVIGLKELVAWSSSEAASA